MNARQQPATPTVQQLLDFEARWPKHSGAKEREIRAAFGLGPARYYQALNAAVLDDRRAALEHDPQTAHRVLDHADRTKSDLRQRRAAGLPIDRSTR